MKKTTSIIILSFMTLFLNAGLVNLNPDPEGDLWLSGGWKIPDAAEMEKINSLPKITLPEIYRNRTREIPYKLNNSTSIYFRPIFNQQGGSCSQASGIGYNFTYEINSLNGTDASLSDNQFPTHYTYNFLNEGDPENGSTYFAGWEIINSGGIPNVTSYGGMWPSTDPLTMHKIWMNGFDSYKSGMNKRIVEVFTIPAGTPEGLQTIKQYFNDYCDGSPTGGIVNFAGGVSFGVEIDVLPDSTEEGGKSILWRWGSVVNHAMTFAGYNDSIRYDYNRDGKYTNDLDWAGGGIDSLGYDMPDGIVDMKDWEIGAILMVNSWGSGWVNGGKIWVAYRTLALSLEEGGIWTNAVHTIRVRDNFSPSLYLKTTIDFSERKELKIYAGVSSDTTAIEPEHTIPFPLFNHQGGSYGMSGTSNELEFGLDISPLLSYIDPNEKAKFFLCIEHKTDDIPGSGSVTSFSIIDTSGIEHISHQADVVIVPDSIIYLSVDQSLNFNAPLITDEFLPETAPGEFYEYTLTALNGTPPYKWDTISEYSEVENAGSYYTDIENILSTTDDDDGSAVIELPFKFPFYGKLYDKVTVTTDGSIKLEDGFDYIRTEGDILANKTITPFGADLMAYPADGDGIFYFIDDESLTVRWITSLYNMPDVNLDFECKIFSDSRIEFFYGDSLTQGLSWASGISNAKITDAKISSISNTADPSGLKTAFSAVPYPYGMELSPDGIFSGITYESDTAWNVLFRVTDDSNISDLKELTFTSAAGIDQNDQSVSDFILVQNYPNPFNPVTRIKFKLAKKADVKLTVYNISGQKVNELAKGTRLAGRYTVDFDGSKLNSGVYYYSLEVDGLAITKKMILIK